MRVVQVRGAALGPLRGCRGCEGERRGDGARSGSEGSPRPAPLAGLVPEPQGQGEKAEEGRGEAAVGSVLQEYEAVPGDLQVRQGQHPGGGTRQRRRGLLHRSVKGLCPVRSLPARLLSPPRCYVNNLQL